MAISFDNALGIHAQAMEFRTQRAEVLANNLANVDTPNFKARDMDFNQHMKQATSGAPSAKLQASHQRHFGVAGSAAGVSQAPELLYRTPLQPSLDGNTVDEQSELSRFSKNSLDFQASFQMLNSKFKGLKAAISGGR